MGSSASPPSGTDFLGGAHRPTSDSKPHAARVFLVNTKETPRLNERQSAAKQPLKDSKETGTHIAHAIRLASSSLGRTPCSDASRHGDDARTALPITAEQVALGFPNGHGTVANGAEIRQTPGATMLWNVTPLIIYKD